MSNKILVFCTISSQKAANALAEAMVVEELAACVNILPSVRSVYRWQGAVETADEVLLVIKSRENLFESLRLRIIELHPYDVPEVIAVPILAGHGPYLEWIDNSTRDR